nr:unnamed protein product [Callosobruchus chinensis]
MPEIDLFASYLNKKCECFVSWLADPESIAVDAFTISWTGLKETEQAECLVVFPMWKSQPWYPKLESMIVSEEIAPNVENPYPGCSDLIQMSLKRKTIHERRTMEIMPGVNEVLSFLKQQFDRGPQYSTLNVHRSALNLICDAGKSELVDRFMKGVFKLRPNFPRYEEIWDPESVLKYIISLYPLNKLSLEDLTVRKCGEAVETAKHVIFDCPALCRRRSSYLEVVQEERRQITVFYGAN